MIVIHVTDDGAKYGKHLHDPNSLDELVMCALMQRMGSRERIFETLCQELFHIPVSDVASAVLALEKRGLLMCIDTEGPVFS